MDLSNLEAHFARKLVAIECTALGMGAGLLGLLITAAALLN